jgi:hypothetical protein
MIPEKPNYLTSSFSGIVTALVGLLSNYMNNNSILFVVTALIFFISMLYFVVGMNFINERNEFKGIKTIIFPNSKKDLIALSRIIVYFLSAGIIILLGDKFFL